MGLPLKLLWKLGLVQNAAAQLLFGAAPFQHVTPLLRELHWLPICYRDRFEVFSVQSPQQFGIGIPERAPIMCMPVPSGIHTCWQTDT